MKKISTLIIFILVIVLADVMDADAQRRFTARQRYSSVGVTVGAMNYFGDIVPKVNFSSFSTNATRPSVGVNFTRRVRPRVSLRGGFTWGRISGDDVNSNLGNEAENVGRFRRNLSFRNDIKELSGVAIFDLFENRNRYQLRPDFVPYGFIGVAVFHHNPKAYYERGSHPGLSESQDIATGWYALQPLGTEGQYTNLEGTASPYSRIQIAIPVGVGLRYRLNRFWDLSLEVGWRKTFTDYLDDASRGYVSKSDILAGTSSNPRAAAIFSDRSAEGPFRSEVQPDPSGTPYGRLSGYGTPQNQTRGNRTDDDWYFTTSFQLSYILNTAPRRPKFR
ncbi:hypothetical protein FVR03_17330 [Pontibacter qinzhouensis]|uniref:DUF6089 domain-containing protein n=1 Tax=Pontibacter qinzhouensis TaxID=2603253 RepID=A0A5C8JIT1_9BACT|nr:DUF6089 family protein [Pontibacter qinzhouensis]TXK36634.1 hypothetical protein FVR03_17330 [Pontibacter qinzhouensis]